MYSGLAAKLTVLDQSFDIYSYGYTCEHLQICNNGTSERTYAGSTWGNAISRILYVP